MSGWISIGEPEGYHLTPNAQRVKELLDKGKSIWSIAQTLRMSFEFVQEQIYEIRKQEAIMARKPKISKEQRTEMLRLHNEERYSVGKLASKFGCSQTAVKTALQAAKIEAEEETMKNTGINPEFDAAVDAMIAESKSADKLEQLEDCENGIPNTPLVPAEIEKEISSIAEEKSKPGIISPEDVQFASAVNAMIAQSRSADAEEPAAIAEPDKLPPVVQRAIDDQISEYEFQISERDSRIEELKEEIAEFRKDIDALREWKEQHA